MPDITALVPGKTSVPSPQQLPARGVIVTAPAALTDATVEVVVPSHSTTYSLSLRWIRQGAALPAAGADCKVMYDETGEGVVVWWAGGDAIDPEADHLVTVFSNSWVNFDTDRPAAFYRDRGRVFLTGIVKSGTLNTVAFTLPAGYRPASVNGLIFPAISNGALGVLTVTSTGAVVPNTGSNVYFTLDGISFRYA